MSHEINVALAGLLKLAARQTHVDVVVFYPRQRLRLESFVRLRTPNVRIGIYIVLRRLVKQKELRLF